MQSWVFILVHSITFLQRMILNSWSSCKINRFPYLSVNANMVQEMNVIKGNTSLNNIILSILCLYQHLETYIITGSPSYIINISMKKTITVIVILTLGYAEVDVKEKNVQGDTSEISMTNWMQRSSSGKINLNEVSHYLGDTQLWLWVVEWSRTEKSQSFSQINACRLVNQDVDVTAVPGVLESYLRESRRIKSKRRQYLLHQTLGS